MNELLTEYLARGWYLVPCRGKNPSPRSYSDASNDPGQVADWDDEDNGYNWGLWPGPSGLLVLDIDTHSGAKLEDLGELPDTLTCLTGRGGFHLYFTRPTEEVGNSPGNLPPHIDVRCDKGQVLVPPSIHPDTGNLYRWRDFDQQIMSLPPWIHMMLFPDEVERPQTSGTWTPTVVNPSVDIARALEALEHLAPDRCEDYQSWLEVGMALSQLGEDGLAMWDAWSQKSPKYQPGTCAAKWETFAAGSGLRLGSLFAWARDDTGYTKYRQAPDKAKPSDARRALATFGWVPRFNNASQQVEVNGVPASDALMSVVRTNMRQVGFKDMPMVSDTMVAMAVERSYHPVEDYLQSLQWDGQDHIAKLADYFTDTHSVFAVWLRRWLIGAVARVMATPKGQQNRMLVIDGKQNLGKSYFVRWLASPLPTMYIESAINPDDKDSWIRLHSKWVWEVAEIGSTMRRADREALKNFISTEIVTVRRPYGHADNVVPALASMIATFNNESGFLSDPTGYRRYMVETLTKINWAYAREVDVNQVWATALADFHGGRAGTLEPDEILVAETISNEYAIDDPLVEWVLEYFVVDPAGAPEDDVTMAAIVDKLREMGKVTSADRSVPNRVGGILTKLGSRREQRRTEGKRAMTWRGVRQRSVLEPKEP